MNVLFVGRIAPNKRQDQLMCLFDYYYRKISSAARLYLVGNDKSSPEYRMELEELRLGLTAREHIVFTGKVTDEELFAYYHAADVFVCASEHEGFCLPLIEAMAFGIPVLAFDAAAVPETLGNSGLLFNKWDLPSIAEHITLLQNDPAYHSSVIAGQMDNLKRFSREEALSRLSAISEFLLDGKHNPLISYLKPS
jgi:glycosyltransferase involved in cell wall biosynthesis